jgi:hypothetical protein
MTIKAGTQRARLLTVFLTGRSLHRFQAEELGCHALHSLISGFEADGLKFDRRTVEIEGRWGTARVSEYWLNKDSFDPARRLMGFKPRADVANMDAAAREYARASGA